MAISIETLRPGDGEARLMLSRQAFGHTRAHDPNDDLPTDRYVAVYDADELIGTTTMIEGGHWFGGRPVAGPGISGVAVAPHRRGTGVARPMLDHVVHQLHAEGAAISGLLPTTAGYYRGAGWEMAGDWITQQLPVTEFEPSGRADADIEPFELDELPSLAAAYDGLARLGNGHVLRGERWWWLRQRIHRQAEGQGYRLRVRVGDRVGYLILQAASSDRNILDLQITDIGAEDAAVLRALGGLVARFSTVADLVTCTQPPWILEALTSEGQRWNTTRSFGWMLRIVDLARAFRQRGWAPISGEIVLEVSDPVLDANRGSFRCRFDAGTCHVEPTEGPGVAVSVQALASWYTGWKTAAQLEFLGALHGADAATVAFMDGLITGPVPLTPEFY